MRRDDEEEPEDAGTADQVRGFATVTHPGRIPIAEHEGVSYMYLDMVFGPAGTAGQVVYTADEIGFHVVGRDLTEFLDRHLTLLEVGALHYDPVAYAAVVPAEPGKDWADLLR